MKLVPLPINQSGDLCRSSSQSPDALGKEVNHQLVFTLGQIAAVHKQSVFLLNSIDRDFLENKDLVLTDLVTVSAVFADSLEKYKVYLSQFNLDLLRGQIEEGQGSN